MDNTRIENVAARCALLLAALLGAAVVLWPALALAAPPCPPAGSFPTPGPGVPNAPSDAALAGGVLTWTDNADDEDGYLICAGPGDFQHTVGADSTAFAPPPGWPPECPDVEFAHYTIYAFNDSGLSSPGGWSVIVECAVRPTKPSPPGTATAAVLPPSGEGIGDRASDSSVVWVLLGVLMVASAAAGVFRVSRVRAQRR